MNIIINLIKKVKVTHRIINNEIRLMNNNEIDE